METTWPIALGLVGIGVCFIVALSAKWDAERSDLRKANAMDFAQAKIPNAAADHVCKLASDYLAWFETGALPAKAEDGQPTDEDLEIPYIGRG